MITYLSVVGSLLIAAHGLGLILILSKFTSCISVPYSKTTDLQVAISKVNGLGHVGTKQLASVIGKIVSRSQALGPVARLMTRNLYAQLNTSG